MIKSIEFENFRNLSGKYLIKTPLTVVMGKNSTGKTNLLDGIRYAFSAITGDYCRIDKTDFRDSDDSLKIIIRVELNDNSIPSLNFIDEDGKEKCGFSLSILKAQSGRYKREVSLFNGEPVDWDILTDDQAIPHVYSIPLSRTDGIYNDGMDISVADFIESEEEYRKIKNNSKEQIKEQMSDKITHFKNLCEIFNHPLDVDIADPKIMNEKIFIVEGDKEHGVKIGSGYKSIANIFLHLFNDGNSIVLIDEIENHLHPSLLRIFLRELRNIDGTMVIATTHSPVVINECCINEIMDISGKRLNELKEEDIRRLDLFLHPGRGEIIFADNIILVEGYTEEILLKSYIMNKDTKINWTIINVAGVMFKPYIALSKLLEKKVIVISDNDKIENGCESKRFVALKKYCGDNNVKLLEVENTLESDLVIDGILDKDNNKLQKSNDGEYYVVKNNRYKTRIAQEIMEKRVDLSKWHIIKDLEDEFGNN